MYTAHINEIYVASVILLNSFKDLNHCSKDYFFLVLYEACVAQEMNCNHQSWVIFDERQEKGSAQYVIAEMPSWQRNAFSPGNHDMEVAHLVFDKIPSWSRNGFSPGECELQPEYRSVKLDYHQKLIIIKVVSSSIVVATIYFQLGCSIGMRHHKLVQKLVSSIRRQWDLMQLISCNGLGASAAIGVNGGLDAMMLCSSNS